MRHGIQHFTFAMARWGREGGAEAQLLLSAFSSNVTRFLLVAALAFVIWDFSFAFSLSYCSSFQNFHYRSSIHFISTEYKSIHDWHRKYKIFLLVFFSCPKYEGFQRKNRNPWLSEDQEHVLTRAPLICSCDHFLCTTCRPYFLLRVPPPVLCILHIPST